MSTDESREVAERDGIRLIAAERQRQVESEGWTAEHDAGHDTDALSLAAVCYALPRYLREHYGLSWEPKMWPWHADWWKPTSDDRVRELVKAGALIAAEIDRLIARGVQTPSGGDA